MHYIPTFLRPLTQLNTGLESHTESRANDVETIHSAANQIQFEQNAEVPVWRHEEALQGKSVIEHGRKRKVTMDVENPGRHWWIITDGLLENLYPGLGSHADIFDLILAINLCIDEPVVFSQSPGQTVSGAYKVRQRALEYRGDLSPGSLGLALMNMNGTPSEVSVSKSIEEVFEMVRAYRSARIESDEDMDIRIGLHMYDDALTSSWWTAMSNLYFVCENVLCSGRRTRPDDRIAEVTEMSEAEASNWRKAVNRLKHPDKGDAPSLVNQPDLEVPSWGYMRQTTNTALTHTMRTRFEDFDSDL